MQKVLVQLAIIQNVVDLLKGKMVYVLVKILEDSESIKTIGEFNKNIFNKQISNLIFKDDSFIQYVSTDIVLIYLNTLVPKEIPFYVTIMSFIIGFVFHINFLVGFGTVLAVLYLAFRDIIYQLFKWGLRKKGFKGKIEAL